MRNIIDAMIKAREALTEYYKEDAPVVALLSNSITEAEGYEKAYELLFKECGKWRREAEAFKCIGVFDSNGDVYPEPQKAGTNVFVNIDPELILVHGQLPERFDFEPQTAPEDYLQQEIRSMLK